MGRGHTDMSLLSGTVGGVVRVPGLRSAVQPYATAAFGLGRIGSAIKVSGNVPPLPEKGPTTREKVASAGLGLETALGGRATLFTEARYLRVGPALRFVPLGVGVRVH